MSRRRGPGDVQDFAAFTRRIMRAYRRRADAGELEPADLADLLAIRLELDATLTAAVVAVKVAGYSWSEVAEATGTAKQSAHERWSPAVRARQKAVRDALTANRLDGTGPADG